MQALIPKYRPNEHPCITRAREQHERDAASPLWREHWLYRLFVRGKEVMRASSKACRIATGAYSTEPYTVINAAGEIDVQNR